MKRIILISLFFLFGCKDKDDNISEQKIQRAIEKALGNIEEQKKLQREAEREKLRKDLNIKTDEEIFGKNPLLETMYPDRNEYMQDSIKFFKGL